MSDNLLNITVSEAMKLPALSEATLIAGLNGVNRVITSVNIMEVPDIIRFVSKDELLLTTTYPIKDDVKAQEMLIPNLVKKGVAALAIKPVFYGNNVPAFMIEQANAYNFPLIQLSKTASFNKILNPILSEILNRQASILRRNEEVHKNFTNLVLKGGDLKDIADMLSTLQNNPVSVHDIKFRLMSYANYMNAFNDDLNKLLHEDSNLLRKLLINKVEIQEIMVNNEIIEVLVHPIIVAGEQYGYICLWLMYGKQYEMNIIEQAVTVAALEIVKHRTVLEVERRFKSFFIDEIIQKKIDSRMDILTRGESCGWNLSSSFQPLVIEIDNYQKFYNVDTSRYTQVNLLRRLWGAVSYACSYFDIEAIIVDIGSRILILVDAKQSSYNLKLAYNLVKKIQKELTTEKELSISAGIGRVVEDIMDLSSGYNQAVQALEIGKKLKVTEAIMSFDDLGAYRILITDKHNPELKKFSQEFLGDIISSDENENSEMLQTLEVIITHNFNLKEAAKALFIHYNTLRYRVSKIEEIASIDINSSIDRLNLQLAYQILKIKDLNL